MSLGFNKNVQSQSYFCSNLPPFEPTFKKFLLFSFSETFEYKTDVFFTISSRAPKLLITFLIGFVLQFLYSFLQDFLPHNFLPGKLTSLIVSSSEAH